MTDFPTANAATDPGPDLSGALFRNERKERDGQPDYTGRITIGGTSYRLAGWINVAQVSGKTYLRLRATPLDAQPAAQPAAPEPQADSAFPPPPPPAPGARSMSDLALARPTTPPRMSTQLDDDIPF